MQNSRLENQKSKGFLTFAFCVLSWAACGQQLIDRVMTAAQASRGRVEIRVEDTGVGIAPEHLSRIFDLYFTTKERGTGIGLSMVYRIIQMHDGEIEVQSTPGRGTTFRVLLPRAQGY